MRWISAVLVLVGACASGNSATGGVTPPRAAIYSSAETGVLLADQPRASSATIAAPPATVWLAVKKVYADLEVPLTIESTSDRQLGNQSFYRSRQFAGQPMTRFVDCGSGLTGDNASTFRIYMTLLTSVLPQPAGGTKVDVTFVALGQNIAEGSTDRIPCGSTGRLEQLVLERVKAAAGG